MPTGLTLSEPVTNEASKTSKQYLKLHGKRVLIAVPEFFRDTGLNFKMKGNISSVLIPLDDSTRKSLSTVETFVKNNVKSEKYKPLWLNEAMYVNVSQWCNYQKMNNDGARSPIETGTLLGKGFYSMYIHASHVYIGPHKNGETFSLSLHVVEITYKPTEDIMDLIESLSDDFNGAPSASSNQLAKPEPVKRKKRTSRSKKGRDEIDGTKTAPPPTPVDGNVL